MDEEQNKGVETAGKQAEEKKQNQGNKKNPAQKVDSAKKAAKVISKLKNIAVLGPVIGILAIIVLIIGLLAFFFTMPGLFLENIKETAKNLWNSFLNVFDGSASVDRTITDEQMIDLAQRIDSMGYDISAYGFADVLEENENGAPTKIGANTEGKNYIRTYLVASESTYSIANWSVGGAASAFFENFKNLFLDPFNMDAQASNYSQGMIAIVENDPGNILMALTKFNASIDREKEALVVEPSGIGKIFFGTFYFSLSDWTSRYGKPVELMLSLHLATMMPDLSYDIVSQFNTKVNIKFTPIATTFIVQYAKDNGEVVTTEDILKAKEYKDRKDSIERSRESIYEAIARLEEMAAETDSESRLISIYEDIDRYNETLDEYDEWEAKYDDIMDDLESSEGDSGASASEMFDSLAELAETGQRGDYTYWPRIDNIQEHWFYEPIDFSGVYERTSNSTISMSYTPEDEEDPLTNIQNKLNIEATLSNMFIQVREPVAKGPNQKIKDIFLNNEYYRYDGTETRAQAIENARAIDTGKNQYIYKGQWYDVQDRTVEKEPVNFHTYITMPDGTEIKSTKNALSAFSLLEGMHTEASEQIYRNLQELVIDLGYFTEEDFAVPSTQVLEWILPDHIPPMWAIRDVNEYGAFIRSEVNLEDGFEAGKKVIAPADATVLEITDNSIKLKLKSIDDKTLQALQETLGKENENITLDPNCILDMEFLINGIDTKDGLTGDIKRGDEIGTTTNEDIHIIMYNIDKSVVDNIEDYMQPNYKGYGSASAGQWFNPDYNINIEEVQKEVYKKLESYNLTDEAIFVVMGVMQAESGFDVSIDNILPDGSSDGGHGLLQWTGGRRTNLENFCKNNGYQVDSVEGQLEFFIYELEKSYSKKNGYAYPVYETLMTSHDMEECLEMFFSHAEAGYDIPIADDYIYNHNFDITTQELYDMRLTYAVAFSKKQSELES